MPFFVSSFSTRALDSEYNVFDNVNEGVVSKYLHDKERLPVGLKTKYNQKELPPFSKRQLAKNIMGVRLKERHTRWCM